MTADLPAFPADAEALLAKLNGEAALIRWVDLQRFFARGVAVRVSLGLDLIEIAAAFARDRADLVQTRLAAGEIAPVSDAEAQLWLGTDATLWAIVVKPWVLVQGPAD